MKYYAVEVLIMPEVVALLRGGAWIEILSRRRNVSTISVALLRGGAWIEIR